MNSKQRNLALWAGIIFCGMVLFPPLKPGAPHEHVANFSHWFLLDVETARIDVGKLILQLLPLGVGYFALNKYFSS